MTDIDNMNNWNAQIIAEFRANGGEVAVHVDQSTPPNWADRALRR